MPIPQSCPLCSAGPQSQSTVVARVYGDTVGRAVFHCAACDVRYLFPRLSAEEEHRFYTAEFETFMVQRSAAGAGWEGPEKHVAANEAQRVRRMGHLAPLLRAEARVLEVGCSSGFMLYPLANAGHECVGIEPSGVFSDFVRSRGISCFPSLAAMTMAGADKAKFDLIIHYYVLEHITDAVGFLASQLALLRPGGHIVLEVPHANDALTALYQIPAYERFIWVVSHNWYFSVVSLEHAMTKAGGCGKVVLDQRYDLSNHLVWARDGKPGGLGRFTSILGEDLEEHYKQALIKAGMADTLVGILAKS